MIAGSTVETGSAPESGQPWALWLVLALLALAAARVLALFLARTDLFFDEAQYWYWAQSFAFGYFSKPPLIAWSIAGTTALCGDGEACVRLSSPLYYAGASLFLFFAGRALYGARAGFLAAIVFATLPGASFSSTIVSTDVPLLFFWCAALFFLVRLQQGRGWADCLACGIAIGLGCLAKYAMVYIYLCAAIWLIAEPKARWLARDLKGAMLVVVPLLLLAPNLIWNLHNGLATFHHTAANADLGGSLFHPANLLEFLGGQFAIFGPILFPMLIFIAVRAVRRGASPQDRMLLAFSLPILIVITVLAFLSRAHANWAATAFPAATLLCAATMLRLQRRVLLAITLAVNALVLALMLVAPALATSGLLPGDPFSRTIGWRKTAFAVAGAYAKADAETVLTDDRGLAAELLYYLRDEHIPIRMWHPSGPAKDHFQLTIPFRPGAPEPVLLASLKPPPDDITVHFSRSGPTTVVPIKSGGKLVRRLFLHPSSGFHPG